MLRRDVLLGSLATLWATGIARAQPSPKSPRLGILRYGSPRDDSAVEPFLNGLGALGYVDGRNITIEYRHAEGHTDRLQRLAAELVASKPDIMVAFGGDLAPFVRDATKTIPIVFSVSADPVRLRLVSSLNLPESNATGVTFLHDELGAKRLQLLKEAAPRVSHVAFLWNPDHLDNDLAETGRSAQPLNIRLMSLPARNAVELDAALEQAKASNIDAVYVVTSTLMMNQMPRIVKFAADQRLPLIGGWGAWASAGALMSYGPDVNEMLRRTATFVDKILKGARPMDIPVEQPTKFQLIVNLKTAKSLGLTISEAYLLRADQVLDQ
jgi:putative tryptophan/tyrosine transport system substrate-binding protein